VGPCSIAIKSPEAQRLRNLQWSAAGTWLATGFGWVLATNVMIADGDGMGPEHRGLREANRAVPFVFVAVAVVWFVTLFAVLPTPVRITALRRCRVLLWITVGVWLVWTFVRGSSLFR
jgi:fatty acid desaturase